LTPSCAQTPAGNTGGTSLMGDTSPHTVAELEAQDRRFHGIRDTGYALTTALTIPGAGEM
jgi:hypothetical protein